MGQGEEGWPWIYTGHRKIGVRFRDILLRIYREWNIEIKTFIFLTVNFFWLKTLLFYYSTTCLLFSGQLLVFFYHRMISLSSYFGFRRKHWIQMYGSKNSQRGHATGSAEIWSPIREGQASLVELTVGW